MGRKPSLWKRGNRGFFTTIHGKQIPLGHDRRAAEREFHRLRARDEPRPEKRSLKVIVLADLFVVAMSTHLAPGTYRQYATALQQWVDMFGHVVASELRPYDVDTWLDGHKWSKNTRYTKSGIVKAWSAWCRRKGYLETNHLRDVRVPSGAPRGGAPPGDLDRLMVAVAARSTELRELMELLIDTGCRPGEIMSLEASQIDYKTRTAAVRGKRGKRTVGLTVRAVAILKKNSAQHVDGPVMRNPSGRRWLQPTLKRYIDQCVAASGLGHIVPYAFRHGFWSRAHKAGVSDIVIMKQLGHTSLKMLSRVYAHPDAETLVAAVDLASRPTADQSPAGRPHKPGKKQPKRRSPRG